jgi:hypothetical protein
LISSPSQRTVRRSPIFSRRVEIWIGDRIRVLRSIRSVAAAVPATPDAPSRVPPPYGTNADVAAGRRFVLVIDQESFEPGRESLVRNAVDG